MRGDPSLRFLLGGDVKDSGAIGVAGLFQNPTGLCSETEFGVIGVRPAR